MPEISRFYGIIIRMYFRDHNPPHFHAEYQGMKAEYNLRNFEIIDGNLPKRANGLVVEWASKHSAELMENWEKAAKCERMVKIKSLE